MIILEVATQVLYALWNFKTLFGKIGGTKFHQVGTVDTDEVLGDFVIDSDDDEADDDDQSDALCPGTTEIS